MEEKPSVVININGGSPQINPIATEAVQNFYFNGDGKEFIPHPTTPPPASGENNPDEAEAALAIYINKERVRETIQRLRRCTDAGEAGKVVKSLVDQDLIFEETARKERFIEKLLPFLDNFTKGKTVENLRKAIRRALDE